MKNRILIILMVLSVSIFGQNHLIGVKGGGNRTNVKGSDPFSLEIEARTGLNVGLVYENQIKRNLSLGLELLYTQKGYKSDILFTNAAGKLTDEKGIISFNYDYLVLPIKCGSRIEKGKFSGFVDVGIVPGTLISAKVLIPKSSNSDETIEVSLIDQSTKFYLGGLFAAGVGYRLANKYLIFSSFSYHFGLNSASLKKNLWGTDLKHIGCSFSVGIKYIIKKY